MLCGYDMRKEILPMRLSLDAKVNPCSPHGLSLKHVSPGFVVKFPWQNVVPYEHPVLYV